MSGGVDVALAAGAVLGEGPTWDTSSGRLLWVDILASEVHAYDPSTGTDTALAVPQHVGAAKPRAGGGLVLNLRDGVALRDPGGATRWLAEWPEPGRRGNDAAVGPDGALWAGSMRYDEALGGGRLRRVAPDGTVRTVLPAVTVSNGIAWSPDARLAYYVDTPTRRIDAFEPAPPYGRRPFARTPGLPDGLTVDAGGCVWVALWGAGRVLRYTPGGVLDRVVEVPARQTTACAFGGPGLRDLYITSARTGAPPDDPHAGSLLVLPDAGQGVPAPPFPG